MEPTRVGLVGAGYIAGRHATCLGQLPAARVVGVADPRADRAAALARACGAPAYASGAELLDAQELDALYLCVPPHAHGGLELEAVRRGLPLFVEKPLAADQGTAEELADRIEAAGLLTAVGYHWRYLDTLEEARRLLAGAPAQMVLGAWLDKAPGTDWWARQDASGGQTVEQVTHLLDVARVLVGEVASVRADAVRSPDGPGDIAHASTSTVRFASGAVGSFSSTCLAPRGVRIGVDVFAPGLAMSLTETELVVSDREGARAVPARVDPILAEDRAFVAAVRGEGDDVRAPYAEALCTHRLATAVATAASTGEAIELLAEAARG
jgi:myo-inositol 2-dehydrogenase/D-chiro-inositol 1-dehydrogenase